MYEYAGITGYKPDRDGTHLKIFIPDRHLEEAIVKKRIKDCMIWLDDGRHISAEQRKKHTPQSGILQILPGMHRRK